MNKILNRFSVLIAISLTLIAILVLYSKSDKEEYFVYALDDPYIHLDIAQNLAFDGNYGVNKGEFSSPSSSPIWTFLLAGVMKIFGNYDKIPFFLNLAIVPIIIFLLNSLLLLYDINRFRWILLSVIPFIIAIPTLVISGMEHSLHIALMLLLFLNYLNNKSNRPINYLSFILLLVLPLVRYESLFFTLILSVHLFFGKQYKQSILFLILPLIPVITFGLFNIENGYHFFPNSIILKGSSGFDSFKGILVFCYRGLKRIMENTLIFSLFNFILLNILASLFFKVGRLELLLCLALLIFQAMFAQFGWLYRYEAYILALALPVILGGFNKIISQIESKKTVITIFFLLLSTPFFIRATQAYSSTTKSIEAIKAQHFNFSKLIEENYPNSAIAMNDIGVTGYYNENYILDVFGLSNIKVADAKKSGNFNNDFIRTLFLDYNPNLIIVYRSWFAGDLRFPKEYKLAYQWEIFINFGAKDFLIDFYVPETELEHFVNIMDDFDTQSTEIYKRKVYDNR